MNKLIKNCFDSRNSHSEIPDRVAFTAKEFQSTRARTHTHTILTTEWASAAKTRNNNNTNSKITREEIGMKRASGGDWEMFTVRLCAATIFYICSDENWKFMCSLRHGLGLAVRAKIRKVFRFSLVVGSFWSRRRQMPRRAATRNRKYPTWWIRLTIPQTPESLHDSMYGCASGIQHPIERTVVLFLWALRTPITHVNERLWFSGLPCYASYHGPCVYGLSAFHHLLFK